MDTKAEMLGESRIRVDFSLKADEVVPYFGRAELAVRQRVKMLEMQFEGKTGSMKDKKVSEEALANEAARVIVQDCCEKYVKREGLRLAAAPQVDLSELPMRGKGFKFAAVMQIIPQATLSSIENIKVTIPARKEVTDDRVMDEIQSMLREGAELVTVTRAADFDDVVNVTFDNTIDGKDYEGSHIDAYDYHMGSLILPQEFEDALYGMAAGDKKYVSFVVDPEFENTEIAGKPTTFDIVVNEVKTRRIPFIDNTLAKQMGFTDLAAWKESVRQTLGQLDEKDEELLIERAARKELVDRMEGEVPSTLVDEQVEKYFTAFSTDLKRQGIAITDYCEYMGIGPDEIKSEMREEVYNNVAENLALEALFRKLSLTYSDEDVEETAHIVQVENGVSSEEFMGGALNEEQQSAMVEMTIRRMATEWLLEHVEVEKAN